MAKGGFKASKKGGDAESLVVAWLKDRYKDYIRDLCALMNHEDSSAQVSLESSHSSCLMSVDC